MFLNLKIYKCNNKSLFLTLILQTHEQIPELKMKTMMDLKLKQTKRVTT